MTDSLTTTTPTAILATAKTALYALRAVLITEEARFLETTLPHRLKIGLHCLKAHMVFAVNPGKGGRPKKPSIVDGFAPKGFEGWLADECSWLKKATAYRYMTALKGLGLSELSTEEEVEDAVRQTLRIGPVTVKSLCDAAVDAVSPPAPVPPNLQQSEFEFLREGLTHFRAESERLLRCKDQLQANPEFLRVASARAYATLCELTGSNWTPCDEPDDLASIDPDSITL